MPEREYKDLFSGYDKAKEFDEIAERCVNIMALIKCPECGQEVSDRAAACPKCAFPLSELRTDGVVKIKLHENRKPDAFGNDSLYDAFAKTTAKICDEDDKELWTGTCVDHASFHVEKPTNIKLIYGSKVYYPGLVEAGKKYAIVKVNKGFFSMSFKLMEVDAIDAD